MNAVEFLYNTAPGRRCLKVLVDPGLSKRVGAFLDTPASKALIKPFVKNANIDLDDYETGFGSFNECFTRRIKPGLRPIDRDPEALIAPCDGLLSAYVPEEGTVIPVKQTSYTLSSLLGGDPAYERFLGGLCLVYRLCVDNYHRYCYVDSGEKGGDIRLPGVLHTVRPAALEKEPVFIENCREYTVIESRVFGPLVQMEVGAMLVGRICNHTPGPCPVHRGDEKGMFLYGGSTVIVLVQPGRVRLEGDYLERTARGLETPVRMGQRVGRSVGE